MLNANEIKQIKHATFLGVYIDERLSWDEHIKQVASKVAKSVGILRKLKPVITCKLLLLVYNSLVLPYFTYCNLIWSIAYDNIIHRLVVLQNKAVRIIDKAEYLAHVNPIFNSR